LLGAAESDGAYSFRNSGVSTLIERRILEPAAGCGFATPTVSERSSTGLPSVLRRGELPSRTGRDHVVTPHLVLESLVITIEDELQFCGRRGHDLGAS